MRRFAREIALIAILLGVVVAVVLVFPSVRGFLAERAYQADRALLQGSVDQYRETTLDEDAWPTIAGQAGIPNEGEIVGYQCDLSDELEVCSWLDFDLLVEAGGLASTDAVNSAESTLNVSATNAPSGSYGWYVDEDGAVGSEPVFLFSTGYP